jgi:ribosomal protein S21
MSVTRIKVTLDDIGSYATKQEKDNAFRKMHSAFKTQVNKSGILVEYKQKQYFESKSQKKRRKQRQAEAERRKEALKKRLT